MWKDIIGFEGIYKINEYGEVYNCLLEKYMKPYLNNKGYKCIDLSNNGKKYKFSVHRLVAMHFVPNPENLPIVLHIDNIKTNTHYQNLKWGTYSENNSQAIRDGLNQIPQPDNRKHYMVYNNDIKRFCYGVSEISNLIGQNEGYVRNRLHREKEISEGEYQGYKIKPTIIIKPIYFE